VLEREQSCPMTRGIAADAPVQGGMSTQRVEPLAPAGAVARYLRRSRFIRKASRVPVEEDAGPALM
jgi:hypothetical protein